MSIALGRRCFLTLCHTECSSLHPSEVWSVKSNSLLMNCNELYVQMAAWFHFQTPHAPLPTTPTSGSDFRRDRLEFGSEA